MKNCSSCQRRYPDDYSFCPHDQNTLDIAIDLMAGDTIRNKYEIIKFLEETPETILYRARHLLLHEDVVLKVLRPEIAVKTAERVRFFERAQIPRHLHHKNVPEIVDFDETELGQPFIVREYVAGESLKSWLGRAGILSAHQALKIASEVCAAVHAGHQVGIGHYDLHSDHVLIGSLPDGSLEVKVIGFKRASAADRREDVRAIGALLYEMFTGSALESPNVAYTAVPKSCAAILKKTLDPDGAKRFSTVEKLRLQLETIDTKPRPKSLTLAGKIGIPTGMHIRSMLLWSCGAFVITAALVAAFGWELNHSMPTLKIPTKAAVQKAVKNASVRREPEAAQLFLPGPADRTALFAFKETEDEAGDTTELPVPATVSLPAKPELDPADPDRDKVEVQNRLAEMYSMGAGVPHDDELAAFWYRQASDRGYAAAQNSLGDAHSIGRGVAQSDAQAVYWYRRAANQGYAPAENNLGTAYANGRGVPNDELQAARWYRRAADHGSAVGQANLAWMYENGVGVKKDQAQALIWYRKAAEQQYAPAQNKLGAMYEAGVGVTKNRKQAVQWYKKAAAQGDDEAKKALERMGDISS
jgi:TPR repeat protein/tRNA A-37 threonylcarbamoyl transferase component Bud32